MASLTTGCRHVHGEGSDHDSHQESVERIAESSQPIGNQYEQYRFHNESRKLQPYNIHTVMRGSTEHAHHTRMLSFFYFKI
jgi:hypothetical protein